MLAVVGATSWCGVAYGQSPADGARVSANATVEFLADEDALGEQHRLKIARDSLLTDVVYDRADPDELGQWFVVPQDRGIGPGTYYWQACWTDFDTDAGVCTAVRTLYVTTPRAPTLTFRKAKSVVREVFGDYGAAWAAGYGKRYGCRRVSRVRMSCRPSAWAGDTRITARLRMLNQISGRTRVRGRIVYFNEYCAEVTPERDCSDSQRVAGHY